MRHSALLTLLKIDAAALAILLSATAFLAAAVVLPVFRARTQQEQLLERLDAARYSTENTTETITDFQRRIKITSAQIAESGFKPQGIDALNQRLARLTAISESNGLTIEGINPGPVSPTSLSVPIKLSGTCHARACHDFLRALREEYPDTAVTAFALVAPSSENDRPPDSTAASRFSMQLLWFTAPAPTAPPAQPQPQPAIGG